MNEIIARIYGLSGIEKIASMYQDPRRVYHGRSHINYQLELISKLAEYRDFSPRDLQILVLSSVYHDVIYEAGMPAGFNETASATLFLNLNPTVEDGIKQVVFDTILATSGFYKKKTSFPLPEDDANLLRLFLDIDLHSFQSDSKQADYAIIEESKNLYPEKSSDQLIEGRLAFLQAMCLRADSGFFYKPFPELLKFFDDDKALREIQASITSLLD